MSESQAVLSEEEIQARSRELDGKAPQDVLAWAFKEFHPDIALACSFGGVSGVALLDMSVKLNPQVKVFYLDTDFLFPETYALRDEAIRRYGIEPLAYKSRWTPQEQAREFGEALWQRDPDMCCQLRKVEPNYRALEGQRAWISGIRRDQGDTRRDVGVVEWDTKFEMLKVNPLATWTEAQVWQYIEENQVPYNPLHDQGYPSIGCTYCTRAVKPGEGPQGWPLVGFREGGVRHTYTRDI